MIKFLEVADCGLDKLKEYTLSSYPKYFKRTIREGLCREDFLACLELPSSVAGMRRYQQHLALSEAKDPKERERLGQRFCRGWFLGSKEEKKALAKDLARKPPNVDWDGVDLKELNEANWEELVLAELQQRKKTQGSIDNEAKGADWKIEIARALRTKTTANNRWIAMRLHMGHPSRVSNLITNKH